MLRNDSCVVTAVYYVCTDICRHCKSLEERLTQKELFKISTAFFIRMDFYFLIFQCLLPLQGCL